MISSWGQIKKMNGLYTTKPFRILPHLLFCQRLLGVRPTNLRTSETELTLSMMRLRVVSEQAVKFIQ